MPVAICSASASSSIACVPAANRSRARTPSSPRSWRSPWTSRPPLLTVNAQAPPELADLVMKLLEKDPDRRPGSAREVVEALQMLEKVLARQNDSRNDTQALSAAAPMGAAAAGQQGSSAGCASGKVLPRSRRRLALIIGGAAVCWRASRRGGAGADPHSIRPGGLRHQDRRSRFLLPGQQGGRDAGGPQDKPQVQPEGGASGEGRRRARTGSC